MDTYVLHSMTLPKTTVVTDVNQFKRLLLICFCNYEYLLGPEHKRSNNRSHFGEPDDHRKQNDVAMAPCCVIVLQLLQNSKRANPR